MMRYLGGLAAAVLITAQAAAAEPVTTAGATSSATPELGAAGVVPPLSSQPMPPAALDDRPSPPAGAGCSEVADRKPHGAVWAGVGTHGYRNVGTAMTAPVGKCGTVSIAVSRTEGGFYGRHP